MRNRGEKGQAVLLMLVAMGLFVFAALGLAIDGSQLYAQRQMAQVAADSAAQAGIMSIFDGTNTGANAYGTPPASAFTCASGDERTPCVYALKNGFGNGSDTVTVSFPASVNGTPLSIADPVPALQVTVTRNVNTTLMGLLGSKATAIKAIATAAIVDVVSPVPVIVTHPTMSGSLSSNGSPSITICGGPTQSIQINSSNATAFSASSSTKIDLSKAGPNDPGNCTTGTGANFGSFGAPASPTFTFLAGTAGKFIQPSSPIQDPLASVPQPARPSAAPAKVKLSRGASGCPAGARRQCYLYSPGLYTGGISVANETAVFKPGLYYMDGGGFSNGANGEMVMSTGFANDPVTGQGMVVFNTGVGTFNVGANAAANLVGAPLSSSYKGILFFQDRSSSAQDHYLGGNGTISLTGTIYITNDLATMKNNAAQFQTLHFQGNSGSSTLISGEIIVSALSMGGSPSIAMQLNPNATLHVRQVALVN